MDQHLNTDLFNLYAGTAQKQLDHVADKLACKPNLLLLRCVLHAEALSSGRTSKQKFTRDECYFLEINAIAELGLRTADFDRDHTVPCVQSFLAPWDRILADFGEHMTMPLKPGGVTSPTVQPS